MSDVQELAVAPALPATPVPGRTSDLVTLATVRKVGGMVALIGAWELYARLSNNRLIPTTGQIAESLWALIESGDLWFHARLTLFRGFTGLALAVLIGVIVGVAMARNRWIDAALEPLLSGLYAIPKISLYPVMIAILGLGGAAKIWQVALECAVPIAFNAYAGAKSVDANHVALARNVGASPWRVVRDIVAPSALPWVLTGLRIATPIMLIVITVTELIGESRGLGFLIGNAQANFRPEEAMAVVVVLGVLGFTLDRLNVLLGSRLVFWQKGVQR